MLTYADASQVRVGSVVVVGEEHMHVTSKKGSRVEVLRQIPKLSVLGCLN